MFADKFTNCEHLKYVWIVYCFIISHEWDLQPQKPKKTEFDCNMSLMKDDEKIEDVELCIKV